MVKSFADCQLYVNDRLGGRLNRPDNARGTRGPKLPVVARRMLRVATANQTVVLAVLRAIVALLRPLKALRPVFRMQILVMAKSAIEQDRDPHRLHHRRRGRADDQAADAGMPVGAHYQQIMAFGLDDGL